MGPTVIRRPKVTQNPELDALASMQCGRQVAGRRLILQMHAVSGQQAKHLKVCNARCILRCLPLLLAETCWHSDHSACTGSLRCRKTCSQAHEVRWSHSINKTLSAL